MSSDKKVKYVRVGVKLLKQLSTTFYTNKRMIFDELISNSRDAFATRVDIDILPDKVVIADNGEGMSADELAKFFYISYTEKDPNQLKTHGNIKRHIIGKFGVGKLSMAQICGKFEVITNKGGYESRAVFDFTEIEKKSFLDEVSVKVVSTKTETKKTGTTIIMTNIKDEVSQSTLNTGLSKTMPLSRDFKIFINKKEITPERKINGKIYVIEEKNAIAKDDSETEINLGHIFGELLYTEKDIRTQAGVYIKVFGRRVNENPRIVDLALQTSGRQFRDRTYCELNVNSLNDNLLTSRSGFIEDSPKYQALKNWIKKLLNKYNVIEGKRWSEQQRESEQERLIEEVTPRINLRLQNTLSQNPAYKTGLSRIKEINNADEIGEGFGKPFKFLGKTLRVSINNLGESTEESLLRKKGNDIYLVINSEHPLFKEAKRHRFLPYHTFKVSAITIAFGIAENLEEAKEIYHAFSLDLLESKFTEDIE